MRLAQPPLLRERSLKSFFTVEESDSPLDIHWNWSYTVGMRPTLHLGATPVDAFTETALQLDMQNLTTEQMDWLHELKTQAMRKVAREFLQKERGY